MKLFNHNDKYFIIHRLLAEYFSRDEVIELLYSSYEMHAVGGIEGTARRAGVNILLLESGKGELHIEITIETTFHDN